FFTCMIFILTFGSIFFAYYLENFTQSGLPTPFSLLDIEKEKNPTNETIIAETSKADEEYFNDILFVGDSLTVGLRAYGYIPSAQVYALTGINVSDALTKKFITFSGSSKQYSISQAVAKTKPEKIIFLMGINGLAWYDENVLLEQYEELVRQIISSSPNSFLALQSLYPVTQSYTNSEPRITNKKIDEFNKKIIKIAKDLNIYYLDTASVLKDSKGNLKQEFSSDGLHINKKGYDEVLEYILKHQF
ncbi:MAG: GDSL-type esterase/lipase family protein, partial [Oscillospiraceae bacterium]